MGRKSHGGRIGRQAGSVIRTVKRAQRKEHRRLPERPAVDVPLPDADDALSGDGLADRPTEGTDHEAR
jgi:hypothetical protein